MLRLVRRNSEVPGLVQLHSRISNEAARADHPSHEYFRARYEVVRGLFTELFALLEADGRLPDGADPAKLATLMVAMVDGLQTQWMYDDGIDMPAQVASFFDLLGAQRAALQG